MIDRTRLEARRRDERGASLVEYALLVALIAVVCTAAVTFLGRSGSGKLKGAGDGITGSTNGMTCYNSGTEHYYVDANGMGQGYLPGPCP